MSLVAGSIAVISSAIGFSFYRQYGQPPIIATSIAVIATAYSIRAWHNRSIQHYKQQQQQRQQNKDVSTGKTNRRWSFTSQNMAQGSFPPNVKFEEAIINVVLTFKDSCCPTKADIRNQIIPTLLKYERFNSIYDPTTKCSTPLGEEDLNPHDLIRSISFTANNKQEFDNEIKQLMEEHAMDSLATGQRGSILPWWEFVILQNTSKNNDGVVVWRIHHALGDGLSLVEVAKNILLNTKGEQLQNIIPTSTKTKKTSSRAKRYLWDWIIDFIKAMITILSLPVSAQDDPTMLSKKTPIDQIMFPKKHKIYTFQDIPLNFVKKLKTAAGDGYTVNDILFTCTSQAIHDYLQEEKDPIFTIKGKNLQCRALLPVALPRQASTTTTTTLGQSSQTTTLRNLWCFISCDLFVGISSINNRLQCLHETLLNMKTSLIPVITMGLQTYVLKYFPTFFNRDQLLQIFTKHTMVFSNVPGPQQPVMFADKVVETVQMIHFNLIPQIGLLSYRGMIFGNVCLGIDDNDMNNMLHRDRIALHFSHAFVQLASVLNVKDVPKSIQKHADLLNEA